MLKEKISLWEAGEYTYPTHGGFTPFMITYLHDEDDMIRPSVLVAPGGAYCVVSSTEGELVAKKFYAMGYNAFVLAYSCNLMNENPLLFQPLKDIGRAVAIVRKNANRLHIDPEKVAICGFSAAGHLCASLATKFDAPELAETGTYAGISKRPNAVILSYPVITFTTLTHGGTRNALIGPNPDDDQISFWSADQHVSEKTPPTFLWATVTDEAVPVDNSLLFFAACKKAGVPVELHLFERGNHGLSVADDDWENGRFGDDACMEQMYCDLQYMVDELHVTPQNLSAFAPIAPGTNVRDLIKEAEKAQGNGGRKGDSAIAKWPEMADAWLRRRMG